MLLIRQLDHFSTEESVYNAVSSLQGVVRTLLIRDKMTRMSCEFAFIEFSHIQVEYFPVIYLLSDIKRIFIVRIDGVRICA